LSNLTNYAENALIDFVRGQGLTLPASWYFALGTAASDGSFTEITGTGYARVGVARSLANWAGTQGAGTTLASTGTSHTTSNNNAIGFGTSGSAWGPATQVGLFDASSGGNCWMYRDLESARDIGSGEAVALNAGEVSWTLGLSGGMSDYLANKMIDLLFRAQAYAWPATVYAALFTVAPNNAGGGTEVSGGGYLRMAITSGMTQWSGTQAAGSTAASSGTGGRTSNNASIVYPTPTGAWGTVVAESLKDASTAGNFLFSGALGSPRSISSGGSAPTHDPDTLSITFA
jgi:hypothetical protein